MYRPNRKTSLAQKQIPTLLGLLILIGALASGLIFFGDGTGVFSPRANPQATPKKVRLTNLTEESFTVSFYTDEATTAFVRYGQEEEKLNSQASDDRDQLSGTVEKYRLHHITVRGLEPKTTYYYVLGTGSKIEFDNEGVPFKITTGNKINKPPPEAKTVYGSVSNADNTPAEGAIVYLSINNARDMSSLVKGSGSWAVPLSKARIKDGSDYAEIDDKTQLNILAQGQGESLTAKHVTTVEEAQPVEELILKADSSSASPEETATSSADLADGTSPQPTSVPIIQPTAKPEAEPEAEPTPTPTPTPTVSIQGELSELLEESAELESTASTTLDLDEESGDGGEPIVTNSSPKIKGKAKPNVQVSIEIHSDNQIQSTVTADDAGDFEIDLNLLKQGLEPGEHTATYSYIDPDTGEEVTKTKTFWVEEPDAVLAQANTSNTETTSTSPDTESESDTESETNIPYGSGNPYSLTPSPSPTIAITPTSTPSTGSASGTRSAVVATNSTLSKAGSAETTIALVIGGLFFVLTGAWSWWLATELEKNGTLDY